MRKTEIEWTESTWNPVTGCTKISQGCKHCYAERMAKRLAGRYGYPADEPFRVTLHPGKLAEPLHWRKPQRVFVNSMSDLFHPDVPFEFVNQVFAVMALTPQHMYQILTKRPERMMTYLLSPSRHQYVISEMNGLAHEIEATWSKAQLLVAYAKTDEEWERVERTWPLPNVWLGVSVEDQAAADERIPLLLQTPAAVRFLSLEPLLGPVDLTRVRLPAEYNLSLTTPARINALTRQDDEHFYNDHEAIDWVIVGGESGPGARPMHPEWVRSLRDQCVTAGVPFFFKGWGEWLPNAQEYGCYQPGANYNRRRMMLGDLAMAKVGKKAAGRLLDGQVWDQMPEGAIRCSQPGFTAPAPAAGRE